MVWKARLRVCLTRPRTNIMTCQFQRNAALRSPTASVSPVNYTNTDIIIPICNRLMRTNGLWELICKSVCRVPSQCDCSRVSPGPAAALLNASMNPAGVCAVMSLGVRGRWWYAVVVRKPCSHSTGCKSVWMVKKCSSKKCKRFNRIQIRSCQAHS